MRQREPMRDGANETAGVIARPPLLLLGPLLLGLLLHRARPLPLTARRGLRLGVGWTLVAGAGMLFGWALGTLRRARTPVETWRPTVRIVTGGPYRFSRNPIYVAFSAAYVGISILANALWPLLLLPGVLAAIVRGVIEREERYLERRFGEEYRRYAARVRRWL